MNHKCADPICTHLTTSILCDCCSKYLVSSMSKLVPPHLEYPPDDPIPGASPPSRASPLPSGIFTASSLPPTPDTPVLTPPSSSFSENFVPTLAASIGRAIFTLPDGSRSSVSAPGSVIPDRIWSPGAAPLSKRGRMPRKKRLASPVLNQSYSVALSRKNKAREAIFKQLMSTSEDLLKMLPLMIHDPQHLVDALSLVSQTRSLVYGLDTRTCTLGSFRSLSDRESQIFLQEFVRTSSAPPAPASPTPPAKRSRN